MTRTETDTFGPIQVDDSKLWGAQAERSLGNFRIGWEKQPLSIVRALGIVKRAAAETNMGLGQLDPALGKVIVEAAQEVIDGKLNDYDEFLPWSIVDSGLSFAFLKEEHEKARESLSSLPCPAVEKCTTCGVCPSTWLADAPEGLIQIQPLKIRDMLAATV